MTSNDSDASVDRAKARIAAIARAQAQARPEDIIAGVKEIVGREVAELSPDAKLVSTSYFNHTYMPDFVLEWTDRGKRAHRPIFIRNAITAFSAPRELDTLEDQEPVLLGLAPLDDEETRDVMQERFSRSRAARTLVSDITSIGELAEPPTAAQTRPADLQTNLADSSEDPLGTDDETESVQVDPTPPPRISSPLRSLVRANILRGGRGLLTAPEVATVTSAAEVDPSDPKASQQLDFFASMAADLFEEAAATRLVRAADIIRLALTTGKDEAILATIAGELSDSDLRVLLPYLLERQANIVSRDFWAYIGSLMSLARLEEFADELNGVSIGPLVNANLETWTARRAGVFLNADFDPEAPEASGIDSSGAGTSAHWSMNSGLLTGIAGRWRVTLASDRRRIRGREDGRLPDWSTIATVAALYKLDQIDLRGIMRRVRITAEESGDVAGDVSAINQTLEDSYSVEKMAVRVSGSDATAPMRVEFAAAIVEADQETLGDLTEVSLRFLTHQNAIEEPRLANLLSRPAVSASDLQTAGAEERAAGVNDESMSASGDSGEAETEAED